MWGGRGERNRLTKNTNNVEGMKGAVWEVSYHSLSTDDNLQHQFSPTGERSWCKYQHAVAKSEQPPPHSPTLDLTLSNMCLRTCPVNPWERCILGATQNQNVSFNSTIWNRCCKYRILEFCSPEVVEITRNFDVLTFNSGHTLTTIISKQDISTCQRLYSTYF